METWTAEEKDLWSNLFLVKNDNKTKQSTMCQSDPILQMSKLRVRGEIQVMAVSSFHSSHWATCMLPVLPCACVCVCVCSQSWRELCSWRARLGEVERRLERLLFPLLTFCIVWLSYVTYVNVNFKNRKNRLGAVAHTYNPSCSGGGDQEDRESKQPGQIVIEISSQPIKR
jgi:hypothetical protein